MADWLVSNYYPDPLIEGSEIPVSFHNDCTGVGAAGNCDACNYAGEGSPEGVVTAEPGSRYYDTVGDDHYIKASGSGNTGWSSYIA